MRVFTPFHQTVDYGEPNSACVTSYDTDYRKK